MKYYLQRDEEHSYSVWREDDLADRDDVSLIKDKMSEVDASWLVSALNRFVEFVERGEFDALLWNSASKEKQVKELERMFKLEE